MLGDKIIEFLERNGAADPVYAVAVEIIRSSHWFRLTPSIVDLADRLYREIGHQNIFRLSRLPFPLVFLEYPPVNGSQFGSQMSERNGGIHITLPGINKHGEIVSVRGATFFDYLTLEARISESDFDLSEEDTNQAMAGAALALSCIAIINSPAICRQSLQSRKPRKESHADREPKKDFTLCEIKIGREYAGSSGDAESENPCMRLHGVRGHFKLLKNPRYRNPGLKWWPPHLRGNAVIGTVEKRYAVTR